MLMLYDSHAHLNNEDFTEEERAEFIALADEAVKSGVLSYVNDVGFDLASSKMAADHALAYPWCYAVVGCHPHDADRFDEVQLEMIRMLAKKEKVQAIGEIGLDFHYDNSDREAQRYWFRRQIQLAIELRMPIVIHSRDADNECLQILKEEGAFSDARCACFPERPAPASGGALQAADGVLQAAGEASQTADRKEEVKSGKGDKAGAPYVRDARVLLHCFSGSAELARQYVKLGATISMAGPLTYKNNRRGVEVAETIPIEYLLVETDSPYLAPEPHRGRKNRPEFVQFTARRLADIKRISYKETARITCENAIRFFNIEK